MHKKQWLISLLMSLDRAMSKKTPQLTLTTAISKVFFKSLSLECVIILGAKHALHHVTLHLYDLASSPVSPASLDSLHSLLNKIFVAALPHI